MNNNKEKTKAVLYAMLVFCISSLVMQNYVMFNSLAMIGTILSIFSIFKIELIVDKKIKTQIDIEKLKAENLALRQVIKRSNEYIDELEIKHLNKKVLPGTSSLLVNKWFEEEYEG